MAIEINVVNGIVNISTDGEVPRSYYGAVGASGSVTPMKAHLLGDVTEVSWVSAQEYIVPAGSWNDVPQSSSTGLGTGAAASFEFVNSATSGMTYISSISVSHIQNGKYKVGDSITFVISYPVGMEYEDVPITVTVKSLAYERVLIKIGGDFYEENWYDLVINGTSPTDFDDALSLLSSAFASVGSPYKVYSALLTQSGTDAPVATVLQNTIGDIVWTRDDVGSYSATSDSLFVEDKTFVLLTLGGGNDVILYGGFITDSAVGVFSDTLTESVELNGRFQIEIRIYN